MKSVPHQTVYKSISHDIVEKKNTEEKNLTQKQNKENERKKGLRCW